MKKIFLSLLLVSLLVSSASAEFLTTANPTPKGKFAFEGIFLQDSNVSNNSDYKLTSYGVKGAYGITEKLEFDLAVATGNYSGLPAGVSTNLMAYAAVLKYTFIEESEKMPVTIGGGLEYKLLSQTSTLTGATNGSKTTVGILASKMIIPFIPYLGISYSTLGLSGSDATSINVTLGSAIAWSQQGAVFLEYTSQAITATATNTKYNSGQIGVGVGYTL